MRRAAGQALGDTGRRPALPVAGPSNPFARHSSQSASRRVPWASESSSTASQAQPQARPQAQPDDIRRRAASKWAPIPPGSAGSTSAFSIPSSAPVAPRGQGLWQRPKPPGFSAPGFGVPSPPAGPRAGNWGQNQSQAQGARGGALSALSNLVERHGAGAGSELAWPAKPPGTPPAFRPPSPNQRASPPRWGPQQQRRDEEDDWSPPPATGHSIFAAPGSKPLPQAQPARQSQVQRQQPYRQPQQPYAHNQAQQTEQRGHDMDYDEDPTPSESAASDYEDSAGYLPPVREGGSIAIQKLENQLRSTTLSKSERQELKKELALLRQAAVEKRSKMVQRGGSRREWLRDDDTESANLPQSRQPAKKTRKAKAMKTVQRDVYIPTVVSVSNLARLLDMRQKRLMGLMTQWGMEDVTPDHLITAEDASIVAAELGYNPIVDDEAAFDIYPEPAPADPSTLPHRPPVVTIMGHVDHGKTTLLDTLRSTSVAKGEAGGITQHIGAFSVPVPNASKDSAIKTITFLDTPGHAAFTAMRARGARVTDIIVCVVAADDGVMPQTKEVLNLAKTEENVHLVIAINKVDKPGANVEKVKLALFAEGVQLEDFDGDVPAVEVSGLTGQGLDNLIETISTIAELADLRAERDSKAEGYVLESKVDKGRGPIATVLVLRGTLKAGDAIVAGTTWCHVRQMMDDKGKPVKEAIPGMPVTVAGWKELPIAGDEVLQSVKGERDAKRAIENRLREQEKRKILADVEKINESRKAERLDREEEAAAEESGEEREHQEEETGPKELRLVIKGDVSGTVEALVGSLSGIGNSEVITKVVSSGVGEVVDSDITMAETADALVIGFNVKCQRSVQQHANASKVPLYFDNVIYRVMEEVRKRASALLPPKIEKRVKGEAQVAEIFNINVRGHKTHSIAGCRVTNGAIEKRSRVRVVRNGEDVWEGTIDSLKHLKKDISEAKKGMECGISLEGFEDVQAGDTIQAIEIKEIPCQV